MPMISHLLTHRALLSRPKAHTHETRLGQPVSLVQFDELPGEVSCLMQSAMPIEKFTERSMGVVKEAFVLWFEPDATIGEAWRVRQVLDPSGVVLATNLDVTGVRRVTGARGLVDHIECSAYEYREGANLTWQVE